MADEESAPVAEEKEEQATSEEKSKLLSLANRFSLFKSPYGGRDPPFK